MNNELPPRRLFDPIGAPQWRMTQHESDLIWGVATLLVCILALTIAAVTHFI